MRAFHNDPNRLSFRHECCAGSIRLLLAGVMAPCFDRKFHGPFSSASCHALVAYQCDQATRLASPNWYFILTKIPTAINKKF